MARVIAELPKGTRLTDYISLGVLSKTFPVSQVKTVLAEQGKTSQRQRDLPAHVVVYYVIALALFMQVSTREVLRCLLEGWAWLLGPGQAVKVDTSSRLIIDVGWVISVLALIVGMFLEFIRHALGVNAGCHEVMMHIAQHADNFRCQRFIQDFNGFIYVAFITLGYSAVFHLVNGALAYLLDISDKMWHRVLVGRDNWE